jgi:hypothetical protein
MEIHQTYIGINPFGVLIDESSELEEIVRRAKKTKELDFFERLEKLKGIALESMVNAYEQMVIFGEKVDELEGVTEVGSDGKINNSEYKNSVDQNEKFKDIVFNLHPLSHALQNKAGCCRYQGALFFVLGYVAGLGDKHFLQQAPVDPVNLEYGNTRSVFNDVLFEGKIHHVSIYKESLKDSRFDYSKKNPKVFDSAIGFPFPVDNPCPRIDNWKNRHYSYHRTESGLVIVSEDSRHVINPKE